MIYMDYHNVSQFMKPGDVIAFSGDNLISKIIKWKTKSVISHVGCLVEKDNNLKLIESTTLRDKSGVSFASLDQTYDTYKGSLYWFPLNSKSYNSLDIEAYTSFLHSQNGKGYDTIGAILSAIILYNKEDFSKMFCSELVCAALEVGGVISRDTNCSEVTPIDLLKFPIFNKYYQIKGVRQEIKL